MSVTCLSPPGAVYRGKYKRETVAIKEFLTQGEMEEGMSKRGVEDEGLPSADALQLYRDLRQEVSVLAELSHPNIVSLLGVSLRPMCIVLEFAPLGSLFGILDKRIEAIKASQADAAITVPRMPGGVLGHMMSWKVALQVRREGGRREGRGRREGGDHHFTTGAGSHDVDKDCCK